MWENAGETGAEMKNVIQKGTSLEHKCGRSLYPNRNIVEVCILREIL